MEYPQLYKPSLAEAIDRNEKDLFRASHKLNIACKKAVETAIRENFDGMHLKTGCIAQVLEEYGTDRVNWVLANTVQQKDYDGRFSRDNKEWAKSFPVPESGASGYDLRCDFIVESHPAVLDGFIHLARKEQAMEQEKPEKAGKAEHKPSIKGQLSAPPVPGNKPQAKNRDREVR